MISEADRAIWHELDDMSRHMLDPAIPWQPKTRTEDAMASLSTSLVSTDVEWNAHYEWERRVGNYKAELAAVQHLWDWFRSSLVLILSQ